MSDVGPVPGKGMLWPHPKVPAIQIGIEFERFDTGLGVLIGVTFGRVVNGVWIEDRSVRLEDSGSWENDTTMAHGIGNLIYGDHVSGDQWENGLRLLINAQLQELYDFDPAAAPVSNSEPFTLPRANAALFQFAKLDEVPGQNYPQLGFKPYPPS